MPISWQRALYLPLIILAWLAVLVVGLWLLAHVTKTILVLLLSGIVAYALTPVVSLLARWLPRGVAIALAYVLGFAVLLGLLALIVETAANQVTNLVDNLPNYGGLLTLRATRESRLERMHRCGTSPEERAPLAAESTNHRL